MHVRQRAEALSFDDVRAWLGTQEAIVATPHSQRSVAEVRVKLDGEIGEFPFLPLIDALEERSVDAGADRGEAGRRAGVRAPQRPEPDVL